MARVLECQDAGVPHPWNVLVFVPGVGGREPTPGPFIRHALFDAVIAANTAVHDHRLTSAPPCATLNPCAELSFEVRRARKVRREFQFPGNSPTTSRSRRHQPAHGSLTEPLHRRLRHQRHPPAHRSGRAGRRQRHLHTRPRLPSGRHSHQLCSSPPPPAHS